VKTSKDYIFKSIQPFYELFDNLRLHFNFLLEFSERILRDPVVVGFVVLPGVKVALMLTWDDPWAAVVVLVSGTF